MFRYESQVEALSGLTAKVERLETRLGGTYLEPHWDPN